MNCQWPIRLRDCYILFLALLLTSCSSSPEQASSGEDTSLYIPEIDYSKTSPSSTHTDTVKISDMKFVPEEIKVRMGDTIIWINNDLVAHCITEINKGWTSSPISAGASWKMAVNNGAEYYCAIHLVMKGRIVLEESFSSAP